MSKKRVILEVGQWVSAAVVMGGVAFEIIVRAHWIFSIITGGACLWGIVQKLKHPTPKKETGNE